MSSDILDKLATIQKRKALINYLVESFTPITITTYKFIWEQLKYSNLLFKADYTTITDLSSKDKIPCVKFYSSFIRNEIQKYNFLSHPLPYLADLLNYNKYNDYNCIKLIKINKNNPLYSSYQHKLKHINIEECNQDLDIYTLDTNGCYPVRWITMIADFAFSRINNKSSFVIDYTNSTYKSSNVKHEWKTIINSLSEDLLHNLCKKIFIMMENQKLELSILKTPPYSLDIWKEFCQKSAYSKILCQNILDIEEVLKNRQWFCIDEICSPGSALFFWITNKRNYFSFLNQYQEHNIEHNIKHDDNSIKIYKIAKGGIHLIYYNYLPWQQFKISSSNYYNDEHNICIYNPNSNNNIGISFEEIILLGETLKIENAEFKFKINSNTII
jgi:hypothetical protein